MITQSENDALTRVGPGTPAGELLRRYWHPVAVAAELTEAKPIKAVQILGERLVVFRMPPASGETHPSYGLVAEQCPHRLASLAYGRVDCEGIRCPYHGWKFDAAGRCLEQPAEPRDSKYKDEIRQSAYLVEKCAGLLFAYMGPQPAPLLPRWDVLAREDGKRWIVEESVIDCNWLQAMENSVDPAHLFWLHNTTGHLGGHMKQYEEQREFIRFEYGIMKRRVTPGKTPADPPMVDEHPLVFPTILRHVARDSKTGPNGEKLFRHNLQIRVPVDDEHIKVYRVNFVPMTGHRSPADQDPPYEYRPLKDENGDYFMDIVSAQDSMAWETQGAIADRSQEKLGVSDVGIVMFRKLLKEQIEIVRRGGDPLGVLRDPGMNDVITIPVVNERIGLTRDR
jgi:5,5'-dehydrodivanillate O-demethylase